jgi:ADP-ribosylglycohydrolase
MLSFHYNIKVWDVQMRDQNFENLLDRAQGCLLGQFSGDSLGSLVEFMSPVKIRSLYPDGLKELKSGGTWSTIAGQPTDDSEMVLALISSLLSSGRYDPEAARTAYLAWLNSGPFDCGVTIAQGLNGSPNYESQANGALMRVCPIGIIGAKVPLEDVVEYAMLDASITHPNIICKQANALMAAAISFAITNGPGPLELFEKIREWAKDLAIDDSLVQTIEKAAIAPPDDFIENHGWVLVAFHNALWQLRNADSPQSGITSTVMQGGDADTNAAICGALLGAVYGRKRFPPQWEQSILNCRPEKGCSGVYRPRPPEYWPHRIFDFAQQLLSEYNELNDQEYSEIKEKAAM